jgi:hypothetical protein
MKRILFVFFLVLSVSLRPNANPIFPESLVMEVYFEGDEWFIVVDNFVLEMFDVETFQEVEMFSGSGLFVFKEDFLPDFANYYTVITQDALVYPHQVSRVSDHISTYVYGGYPLMDLAWGTSPTSPVKGPFEGQSLVLVFVYEDNNYDPLFWLCKASVPYFTGGNGTVSGTFDGYLFDQNSNPVANAEIKYVPDELTNPPYFFPPLTTDQSGYFFKQEMPARNYHLHQVVIDGVDYDFDEYISIEPDSVNSYNFNMVITQVPDLLRSGTVKITNSPNPFSDKTVFNIDLDEKQHFQNMNLIISDMAGRILSVIPLNGFVSNDQKMKFSWENNHQLPSGSYLISLSDSGKTISTCKMTIY